MAEGSRRGQRQALNAIAGFLSEGVFDADETDWATLRYQDTSAVRNWLVKRYAPNTAKRLLAALRGVLKECWRMGLMPYDDLAKATDLASVHGESEPSGRALGNEELQKVFDACHRDTSPAGIRDGAIVGLLYGLGLRRAEVISLDTSDYNPVQGIIAVHGKGNKPRLGYALEQVQVLLDAWLNVRGEGDGPMFSPINKGGALATGRFTPQGLALVVKKRAAEAEIGTFSCHDLRRTFITNLLDSGVDLFTVQRLAGHKNISTTGIYDRRGEQAKIKAVQLIAMPTTDMR
ncbi:tyrosine-type recombinase/integrase [Telmatobacter sp. DSM 110680]|uniref:Tyrosine-type recombinase/integrase n=1 Tax=Telmatobacter sp. DSM 110680 TaxID=3036704 RepID=A0AAU7DKK1_9BACT